MRATTLGALLIVGTALLLSATLNSAALNAPTALAQLRRLPPRPQLRIPIPEQQLRLRREYLPYLTNKYPGFAKLQVDRLFRQDKILLPELYKAFPKVDSGILRNDLSQLQLHLYEDPTIPSFKEQDVLDRIIGKTWKGGSFEEFEFRLKDFKKHIDWEKLKQESGSLPWCANLQNRAACEAMWFMQWLSPYCKTHPLEAYCHESSLPLIIEPWKFD